MAPPCYRYPMNCASSTSSCSEAFGGQAPATASADPTLARQFVMFNGITAFIECRSAIDTHDGSVTGRAKNPSSMHFRERNVRLNVSSTQRRILAPPSDSSGGTKMATHTTQDIFIDPPLDLDPDGATRRHRRTGLANPGNLTRRPPNPTRRTILRNLGLPWQGRQSPLDLALCAADAGASRQTWRRPL
jgi:hypothetical protein